MIDIGGDKAWLRPFKNAGKLLVGRGVQGVLSLGYLAFATRTLGVTDFGILTLIHSTMLLLHHVLGFQSWQMVLRYGAKAMAAKNADHLVKLLLFAVIIELIAGLFGLTLIEIFALSFLDLIKVPEAVAPMFRLYALLLPVLLVADVGLGVLRLTDRHDLVSWQLTVEPVIRFAGAGTLFLSGGDLFDFILVWFAAGILSRVTMMTLAGRNIRRHIIALRAENAGKEHTPIATGRLKAPEAGLWRYVLLTNFNFTLSVGITQLGPILIGTVLGPAGAGLYRVAQQFANIIGHPIGKMLVPAIYTDMTWLHANGGTGHRRHMVLKTGLLAGAGAAAMVAVMVLSGEWLIALVAGKAFVDAYDTMIVLAVAVVFGALTFTLEPLLMTAGKVKQVIMARFVSIVTYVLFLFPLVHWLGLVGAGWAVFAQSIGFVVVAGAAARKLLTKEEKAMGT